MPQLGLFDAYVLLTSTNTRAPEHRIETPNPNKSTCYIESTAGSGFKVCCDIPGKQQSIAFACHINVDGKRIISKLFGLLPNGYQNQAKCEGAYSNDGRIMPFMFGETKFAGTSTIAAVDTNSDQRIVKRRRNFSSLWAPLSSKSTASGRSKCHLIRIRLSFKELPQNKMSMKKPRKHF